MNDPLRHVADAETAFIPAEGELRSKSLFHLEQVIANPPDGDYESSEPHLAAALVLVDARSFHDPKAENDSIPIEHGPA
jgi:hypothetical protein